MPREITHWAVLELAIPQLEQRGLTRFANALFNERAVSYLGAVAHDAPYYHKGGGSKFEEVAEKLHGTHAQDTFALLRPMLQSINEQSRSTDLIVLLSFWLGMLSHAATDIIFHPVIYYLTGDYYAADPIKRKEARTAHRAYEVVLDQCVATQHCEPRFAGKMVKVCSEAGSKYDLILNFLDQYLPAANNENLWKPSFEMLIFTQRLAINPITAFLFHQAAKVLPSLIPIAALARTSKELSLTNKISYLNPVSGEAHQASINDLLIAATNKFCDLCQLAESNQLEGVVGESLSFGMANVDAKQAKYFASQPR